MNNKDLAKPILVFIALIWSGFFIATRGAEDFGSGLAVLSLIGVSALGAWLAVRVLQDLD